MIDVAVMQRQVAQRLSDALQRHRHQLAEVGEAANDQIDELAALLADVALVEFDRLLADQTAAQTSPLGLAPPAPEPVAPQAEQLLWAGRPFMAAGDYVEVTNRSVRMRRGLIFNVAYDRFDLVKLERIEIRRSAVERLFAIGDLLLFARDGSSFEIPNMHDFAELQTLIERAAATAKEHPHA